MIEQRKSKWQSSLIFSLLSLLMHFLRYRFMTGSDVSFLELSFSTAFENFTYICFSQIGCCWWWLHYILIWSQFASNTVLNGRRKYSGIGVIFWNVLYVALPDVCILFKYTRNNKQLWIGMNLRALAVKNISRFSRLFVDLRWPFASWL